MPARLIINADDYGRTADISRGAFARSGDLHDDHDEHALGG